MFRAMEHIGSNPADIFSATGIPADGVSVIMPAYNAAAFIHDAIASVLRQTREFSS